MQPPAGTQQQLTFVDLERAIFQVLGYAELSNALEPLIQIAERLMGLKRRTAALGAAQVAGLLQRVEDYIGLLDTRVSLQPQHAGDAVALIDKLLWLLGHPMQLGTLLRGSSSRPTSS
jgi:hypothetical protein